MQLTGRTLGFLLSVAAAPAFAEPNALPSPPSPGTRGTAEMTYDGYAAGLNAVKVRAAIELRSDGYDIGVNFRTSGMIGAFLSGDMLTRVNGTWRTDRAAPSRYRSGGTWRGDQRHIEIDYPDGQPHVSNLTPAVDEAREPIPEAMKHDTTDALSAIAFLLHTVAQTGRCDGHVQTFDGRRVSDVVARTVGTEVLPEESRSTFKGPALRCDLEGRQTAGLPKDAAPDDMIRKVQHSTIWLTVPKPGMPVVPVQMSFEVRSLGHMILYVTQARAEAQLAQFTPKAQ